MADSQWLKGEGEMARKIREFDWAGTSLRKNKSSEGAGLSPFGCRIRERVL